MKTVSIEGALYSRMAERYDDPEALHVGRRFQWFSGLPLENGFGDWCFVMPYTLTFTPPADWNPAAAEVAMLQAKKAEVIAKFQAMVTEIDRQINKLLAIEVSA